MAPAIIAAIIGAASSLFGRIASAKSKKKNNSDIYSAIGSSVANLATSIGTTKAQQRLISEQNAFNAAEAQKAREWNLAMDASKYQRAVTDMQAAGVNPALAIDGHLSTQATSNAQAQQSESGVNAITSLMNSMASIRLQERQLAQEKELKSRELDIRESEANAKNRNLNVQSDILDIKKLYTQEQEELEIKSRKLQNDLTGKQIDEINENIKKIQQQVDLLKKQAATEEEKKLLAQAETALTNIKAYQVVAMLPYEQALAEAQTANQKAAATLSLTEALYKQKLIDSNYIENMIKLQDAEITDKELKNFMAGLDKMFQTGEFFNDSFIGKIGNAFVKGISQVGRVIKAISPLSSFGKLQ